MLDSIIELFLASVEAVAKAGLFVLFWLVRAALLGVTVFLFYNAVFGGPPWSTNPAGAITVFVFTGLFGFIFLALFAMSMKIKWQG